MTVTSPPAYANTDRRPGVLPWATMVFLLSLLGLFALTTVFLDSARGQLIDQRSMEAVIAGRDTRLTLLSVLGYVSIGAIFLVSVCCVAVAAIRGQFKVAVGAVVVIVGANLTTQVLKRVVLERPDFGLGTHNSLPSGHTTVVASLVAALILVSPPRLRPVIAAVGSFAIGITGLSTIVAGWHRPSDVAASVMISLGWMAVACLVSGGKRAPVFGSGIAAVIGSGGALLGLVMIGVRPLTGWDGFALAASVLGSVAVLTSIMVALMVFIAPDSD